MQKNLTMTIEKKIVLNAVRDPYSFSLTSYPAIIHTAFITIETKTKQEKYKMPTLRRIENELSEDDSVSTTNAYSAPVSSLQGDVPNSPSKDRKKSRSKHNTKQLLENERKPSSLGPQFSQFETCMGFLNLLTLKKDLFCMLGVYLGLVTVK